MFTILTIDLIIFSLITAIIILILINNANIRYNYIKSMILFILSLILKSYNQIIYIPALIKLTEIIQNRED